MSCGVVIRWFCLTCPYVFFVPLHKIRKKLATLILIVMEDAFRGVIDACLDIGLSDVRQKAVRIIFPSVDNRNCFEKVIFTSQ